MRQAYARAYRAYFKEHCPENGLPARFTVHVVDVPEQAASYEFYGTALYQRALHPKSSFYSRKQRTMSETQFDLLLKGGHVIDPANNIDAVMDVAVSGSRIARVASDINPALASRVVDVAGLYVTPGLIDIHVHAYHTREPEGLSVFIDHHSFRSGVTAVVDTGTAGAKHFLHFKRTVIDLAKTRIFAFINIVKSGMIGDFEQDVAEFDPELAASIVLAYPEICVGIKTAHYWTYQPW
ncbi:MAG: hypothetical protein JNL98_42750, partial [Bryobacterales bacterium]|nr:hypothetical protein [Bryobacterales bacterium]